MTEQYRYQLKDVPASLVSASLALKLGEGLTLEGKYRTYQLVMKFLSGERVLASREVEPIFRGSKHRFISEGWENVPSKGPTIVIANHTYTGPWGGNAQYFELVRMIAKARRDEPREEVREPYLIMQKGLGNLSTKRFTDYAAQFYELGADSLKWELVEIPEFEKGDITNDQKLSRGAFVRLIKGGAMILYPQGTHRDPNDLNFPQRTNTFLRGIVETWPHVSLVPVRVRPGKNEYETHITIGKSLTVGDLMKQFPVNPIAHFARERIGAL